MSTFLKRIVLAALLLTASFGLSAEERGVYALAYHDVRDVVLEEIDADQYALSTEKLISHFTWLRVNGYVPVSIDQILAARDGGEPLPERAVLLTFDDGLESVYTHVFPLLELFDYPAVVSLVTGWTSDEAPLPTGDAVVENYRFITWDQAREMQASGLIEFASHSHDLHHGVIGNPQANEQPAAVTRLYEDGHYESEAEFKARLRKDLERSAMLIERELGTRPRVITWPYGAFNEDAREQAWLLGMEIDFTLEGRPNHSIKGPTIGRYIIDANPGVDWLSLTLMHEETPSPMRVAQVDLDYVYDEDEARQEENLGMLLDRIKELKISHVFLQAFADPDANGAADALYFPNRHLPMRADLFNRVAWQLETRAEVRVYGWLPVLGYESESIPDAWKVVQSRDGVISMDAEAEPRLSPFHPDARRFISEIYADLAQNSDLEGLHFHDDGRLSEFEDASPAAMAAYRRQFGQDFTVEQALSDGVLLREWADVKSEALVSLTVELAAAARHYRPRIKTSRNMFSDILLDPMGETYHAQDFNAYLNTYDHVALMAMPYFENRSDPSQYFSELVDAVSAHEDGLNKTIFELQTVDWRNGERIPARELSYTMRWLQSLGVKNIAYYPDDFIEGFPDLAELKRGISLAQFPSGELK